MDIKGFGVDIVEIERVERVLKKHPRFAERFFTPIERRYCEKRPRPAAHFALRFAAKEAVAKALGSGFVDIPWKDIEVLRERNGKPKVLLKEKAQEAAFKLGIEEIFISLSFSRENAVASAIALGNSQSEPLT
jgi:holo-[acyl-carrier protein] synthase